MSADFERIVYRQFPLDSFSPHLTDWMNYGLSLPYEEIEPNSAIGKIVVELHQTALDAQEAQKEATDFSMGPVPHEKVAAANRGLLMADARYKVFQGMYKEIVATTEEAGLSYEAAVTGALSRGIKDLDRILIPHGSKDELIKLNEEIACFLGLESELHFRETA